MPKNVSAYKAISRKTSDSMKREYTFSQYRAIDLTLFAVMLLVFEFLIISAISWFPAELYTVSLAAAITAIVMVRWGPFAAIHAVLGGAAFCFFSGAEPKHYIIYCVGNLFSLLSLLLIRFIGSEKIRTDALSTLLYGFCTQVFMQIGRAIVALIMGYSFSSAVGFILTDVLSIVFTMVIVWIVRHLDGMLEEQKSYLLRLQKEREKERGENLE